MSYKLGPRIPGEILRMPTHFGLNPGPRQDAEGRMHSNVDSPKADSAWVRFSASAEQIARHLPPGFEPADNPDLTIEFRYLTDLSWLAGRGYNLIVVSTAARWVGGGEPLDGRFVLVLWENLADPIITGREELGYNKVFADISGLAFEADRVTASASWFGFEFLELSLSGLSPIEPTDVGRLMPGGPGFHWKYIPRTGAWGESDVSYPVMSPPTGSHRRVLKAWTADGSVVFHRATWQELPTQVNIVNGLADLDLGDCLGAGRVLSVGYKDLRDQVALAIPMNGAQS